MGSILCVSVGNDVGLVVGKCEVGLFVGDFVLGLREGFFVGRLLFILGKIVGV